MRKRFFLWSSHCAKIGLTFGLACNFVFADSTNNSDTDTVSSTQQTVDANSTNSGDSEAISANATSQASRSTDDVPSPSPETPLTLRPHAEALGQLSRQH